MKPVISYCLLAAGLMATAPILAQEAAEPEKSKTPAAAAAEETADATVAHATTGEITDLAASSFRIRPWQYQLPARLQVTAAPGTRYLKQREGKRRDVQVGDLVLVVPEEAPLRQPKSFYVTLKPNNAPEPPHKTPEARAVLRLWNTGVQAPTESAITQEDRRSAHVLLVGAEPYFKGSHRGGVNKPAKKEKLYTGVVTALQPLTIQTARGTKEFKLVDDTLVVTHTEIKPEALKKGETVVIRSPEKAGADASLQAMLVAVCPRPEIGDKAMGKILSRENHRKER